MLYSSLSSPPTRRLLYPRCRVDRLPRWQGRQTTVSLRESVYPKPIASKIATRWLEYESQQRGKTYYQQRNSTYMYICVEHSISHSDGLQAPPSTVLPVEPYFDSTVAAGTDVPNINPTKFCTNKH